MGKRIFIISAVLTGINSIIDLCYALFNYASDPSIIVMIAVIIFNKCCMLGSICFTFMLLVQEYKEYGKNDKKLRGWLVFSGIVFVVLAAVLHVDLAVTGQYLTGNGFSWVGCAFSSIIIIALAGRAAYVRNNEKK